MTRFLILLFLVLSTVGCASTMNQDLTHPDGTNYSRNIKNAAFGKAVDVSGMEYVWEKDGGGSMTVRQDSTSDNTKQVLAAKVAMNAILEAFQAYLISTLPLPDVAEGGVSPEMSVETP